MRTLKHREPEPSDDAFFDPTLRAPFPWYGGKSKAAPIIWKAMGDVKNYVEPFAGSLATLLARPHAPKIETINDKDAWVANFWRAVQADPDAVAGFANWPINEADLSARHVWLVNKRAEIAERVTVDPDFFDPKVAGWWVWGVCIWIGAGWCDGRGPWNTDDGKTWVKRPINGSDARGVKHSMPMLQIPGGVHRYTDKGLNDRGITKGLPDLVNPRGVHRRTDRGVSRQLPELGNFGRGAARDMTTETLHAWFSTLRVTCGDWSRVLCKTATVVHGTTGILLDPPYDQHEGTEGLYAEKDIEGLSEAVGEWAIEHGDDKRLRIVLCGYDGTFDPPPGWRTMPWFNGSSVGRGSEKALKGRLRERLWMSPHCFVV